MTINERVSDERIANLIEVLSFYSPEDKHLANNESELASALRELQQYRAAAEKPVACIDRANLDYFDSGAGADVWPASESDSDDVLLYAAPQLPQPAPVAVPDEMEMDDDFDSAFEHGKAVGWNACRAAMLQGKAEPVSQPYTLPLDYLQGYKDGCEWSALMAEANHPQTGDWLYDDPLELAKAIRKGPDMLPTAPDFREIPNSSTNNCRENADSSTKCWCHTCRPVTMTDMRFVVCPECGNKRCPHANDHRNACTGSNEPGQEGSAYPDAPKQEAE
ncbi:hypothetical protein [Atlantibacter hermannii]|uniref:hypothetical protein n=1 Tax=Atlantibacter hermannii TaxID=565 RepID=UPI0028A96935|nr:hypothetical protein [Atlantibacter hermannii]